MQDPLDPSLAEGRVGLGHGRLYRVAIVVFAGLLLLVGLVWAGTL